LIYAGPSVRRSKVAVRTFLFVALAGIAAAIGAAGIRSLTEGQATMQAEIQAFTGVLGAASSLLPAGSPGTRHDTHERPAVPRRWREGRTHTASTAGRITNSIAADTASAVLDYGACP
jgi:hypothetical protein